MFEWIKNWLKGVSGRLFGISSIEKAMGVKTALSTPMDAAIRLWADLYAGNPPWSRKDMTSLNLPSFIASEVARIATIEMQSIVGGSSRAEYLNEQYQPVIADARLFTENAVACGTLILKPYIDGQSIKVDYVTSRMFTPTRFSSSGEMTGCVFASELYHGTKLYTRLESHELEGDTYTIHNKAYVAEYQGNDDLSREVSLSEIPEWAHLEPSAVFYGIQRPLFAVLKMPGANMIDTSGAMGMSVYARAVDLIREADEQFARLIWEMESGKRALFVDAIAFDKGVNGKPVLPDTRLYRTLRFGQENLFEAWSPTLRQKDQVEALESLLQRVEDACGLARGTVSRALESAAGGSRTATELKIMRQRTYALIVDIQNAVRKALTDLLTAMDTWVTIGGLAMPGQYNTTFDFDDSVVSDRQAEFAERMQLVTAGIMQRWEFRSWYLGEDEDVAKAAVLSTQNAMFPGDV